MGISSEIEKGLADFQECISKLNASIGSASVDWQDDVYASFQESVLKVAVASRSVITAGFRSCQSLSRVEDLLQEK